jgi:hypothetical protein
MLTIAISFQVSAQVTQPASTSESGNATQASSTLEQSDKIPQPGELGSPFSVDHFWNHFALELGGGYTPFVKKGTGYFNKGFNVSAGVIDHLTKHWTMLAELQIFGLRGNTQVDSGSGNFILNNSNTNDSIGIAVSYDLLPRVRTSPYLIGGAGYYRLGTVSSCGDGECSSASITANAAGYNGGLGVRRRLYADKRMELFAEGRYHYIASGSTDFGQISLFPVSAGIRW